MTLRVDQKIVKPSETTDAINEFVRAGWNFVKSELFTEIENRGMVAKVQIIATKQMTVEEAQEFDLAHGVAVDFAPQPSEAV